MCVLQVIEFSLPLHKGPIVNYVPGGAVILEGGYIFKTSRFLGVKFFTGKKYEEGQIL